MSGAVEIVLAVLFARGLDINHRPIEMLDAYRPGFTTPPAYHALHHVYPDAYFSAYTKLVDWLVGGGTLIGGRRFAWAGSTTPFARALADELRREGALDAGDFDLLDGSARAQLDVLVVPDPEAAAHAWVEDFIRATLARKLPPEVWVVRRDAADPTARHYQGDVRVNYRTLVLRESQHDLVKAAHAGLANVRRGFNLVPTQWGLRALADLGAYRRTAPVRPEGSFAIRHRLELRRGAPG